jgi:foldase protein PrsA
VTDTQLKSQCKTQFEQAREQVLNLLVTWQWIEKEAKDRNITVSDADVKKSFEQQKKQNFPKDADYQKFLEDSGQTQQDVLDRVKQELLGQKLQAAIVKGKDKVTPAQVQAFYDKNKSRFSQPETRDVRVVLTKDEAKANQAKQAVQGGQSWKAVAKKFSIDQSSKAQGGLLPQQAKGTLEAALDKAVFSAKKGQLSGPVKTPFGYYVFQVDKVNKAQTQSLDQAKQTIETTLKSQNQQKALNDFLTTFRKKWKDKTDCRDGYKIELCKGEKAKATPTPTPAG